MAPDGPPPGHVNDPDNLIDEAFAYFSDRVAEYLAGSDEDDRGATAAAAARHRRLRHRG